MQRERPAKESGGISFDDKNDFSETIIYHFKYQVVGLSRIVFICDSHYIRLTCEVERCHSCRSLRLLYYL